MQKLLLTCIALVFTIGLFQGVVFAQQSPDPMKKELELLKREKALLEKEKELLMKEKTMKQQPQGVQATPAAVQSQPAQPTQTSQPAYSQPAQKYSPESKDNYMHVTVYGGPAILLRAMGANLAGVSRVGGIVGVEIGEISNFFLDAKFGLGSKMICLGPKWNIPINLMGDDLYLFPSIALGPAFTFYSGGVYGITGFIRPGFGIAYVLNDMVRFSLEPFSMDIHIGGVTLGGGQPANAFVGVTLIYQILAGVGFVW